MHPPHPPPPPPPSPAFFASCRSRGHAQWYTWVHPRPCQLFLHRPVARPALRWAAELGVSQRPCCPWTRAGGATAVLKGSARVEVTSEKRRNNKAGRPPPKHTPDRAPCTASHLCSTQAAARVLLPGPQRSSTAGSAYAVMIDLEPHHHSCLSLPCSGALTSADSMLDPPATAHLLSQVFLLADPGARGKFYAFTSSAGVHLLRAQHMNRTPPLTHEMEAARSVLRGRMHCHRGRSGMPPLQKVTRVVGFEAFLLEAEPLAGDLQRHFAASATVAPLPGAQAKGHEIALQVPPAWRCCRRSAGGGHAGLRRAHSHSQRCDTAIARHVL